MTKAEHYPTVGSLRKVQQLTNEADRALHTPTSTIEDSPIKKMLEGIVGAGIVGAGIGFGIGAGVIALAGPAAPIAALGYGLVKWRNKKKLSQEKERLLQEAIRKRDAIIEDLSNEVRQAKAHIEYLTAINALLQRTIDGLTEDLQTVAS